MSFHSAARKERDDKYPSHVLCHYCKTVFKDQCTLGVHVRTNHGDEVKLENSRQAPSHSSGSFTAHSVVLALPCMPIGHSARARTGRQTSTNGSSSSDFYMSIPPRGIAPKNSSSSPENHQEPGELMISTFQNLSSVSSINSGGGGGCSGGSDSSICPSSQSTTPFAASPNCHGAAGVHFLGDSSSSLLPSGITSHCLIDSLDSHVMPSFRSVNLPNPPAYNLGYLPGLSLPATESCLDLGPSHLHMVKECIPKSSPPRALHQSSGPDGYEAGLHVKCPIHHNYNREENTCRASILKTSDFMGSLDSPIKGCSRCPSKPNYSYTKQESACDLHCVGVFSASGEEEDKADLDLSLHL